MSIVDFHALFHNLAETLNLLYGLMIAFLHFLDNFERAMLLTKDSESLLTATSSTSIGALRT